jgi:hypothetical protein
VAAALNLYGSVLSITLPRFCKEKQEGLKVNNFIQLCFNTDFVSSLRWNVNTIKNNTKYLPARKLIDLEVHAIEPKYTEMLRKLICFPIVLQPTLSLVLLY